MRISDWSSDVCSSDLKWLGSRRMLSARAAESVGIMAVRGEQQSHARYFPSSRRAAVMTAGQIVGRNGQSALGSVSAAYVQALLDTAAARGADRERLVADAGITTRQLGDPGWRLDLHGLLRLFDRARHASGDELTGLNMGMPVRPPPFRPHGSAAMRCNPIGERNS